MGNELLFFGCWFCGNKLKDCPYCGNKIKTSFENDLKTLNHELLLNQILDESIYEQSDEDFTTRIAS